MEPPKDRGGNPEESAENRPRGRVERLAGQIVVLEFYVAEVHPLYRHLAWNVLGNDPREVFPPGYGTHMFVPLN